MTTTAKYDQTGGDDDGGSGAGPFIHRPRDVLGYECELVVGQCVLIPWFAKESKPKYPTKKRRSEVLEARASFKDPRRRGQRGITSAASFDEPNWESAKNEWWTQPACEAGRAKLAESKRR